MGEFLTKLEIEPELILRDGTRWVKLSKDLLYKSSDGSYYTIPEGFESDGASIPKWAWAIVGHPFGEYLESAVVHDYPYKNPDKWFHAYKNKRKRADWLILDCMKTQGVKWWKRQLMHKALRMGGWMFWKPTKGIGLQCKKEF